MNDETKNRITVKIFTGFKLTVELRLQLNKSRAWKQDSIVQDQPEKSFTKVHYQGKDYIGRYNNYTMLTLKHIQKQERMMRQSFQEYCPEFNVESLIISIFPQVFVS